MTENKYKHLTKDDRDEIQECLNHGITFKAIAQRIGKDQTTISKEVKKHIKFFSNSFTTTDEVCPNHLKSPYICNGCKYRSSSACHYPKGCIRQKMHKGNTKPL